MLRELLLQWQIAHNLPMLEGHIPSAKCYWVPTRKWALDFWMAKKTCPSYLQEVRKSEEPWENAHGNRIRSLPAVDWIDIFPFLLFDKSHETVHIASSGVTAEFAICNVKYCRQGSDEESSRQSRILSKKIETKWVNGESFRVIWTYTTSTLATLICRSSLHDPKSFQIGSKLLQAGHHGAKLFKDEKLHFGRR